MKAVNNRNWLDWCWHLGLLLSFALTTNESVFAQVTPDQTLGTQVIDNGSIFLITGGTTVNNANLFHSFSSFSVPGGGAAIFQNNPNLTNIFSRVTGGTPSDIQGLIRAQGTANLFLMNPNGIIFGRNAQLNIGGSFVATTANAIQFPGGAEFSSNSPVTPQNNLLSVNPTAFLFNQIAAQGANSIENQAYLAVPDGKSLILLGGRVAPTPESTGQILMNGGILEADGRIEIGGLNAPGTVGLKIDGDNLRLAFPDGVARADISLVNQSGALAYGAGGGGIAVNAKNFNLLNSSNLFIATLPNQGTPETKMGDISINATGVVAIAEDSTIRNFSLGIANGGNINIIGQALTINGSTIDTATAQDNSGAINIQVEDTVFLSGTRADGSSSRIFSTVILPSDLPSDLSGSTSSSNISITPTFIKSGEINIQARNLSLADGASLATTGSSRGDSGDIKIQATDSMFLTDAAEISTINYDGSGNSGNLSIITNDLNLNSKSRISTSSLGSGNSGNVDILARNISLNNADIITKSTPSQESIFNIGDAGNINIETEKIMLRNNGNISSASEKPKPGKTTGRGGNITVTATDLIEIDGIGSNNNVITGMTARTSSSSSGGDITLKTKNFIARNGGGLSSEAAGDLGGNAGSITINASESVELTNSSQFYNSTLISTGVIAPKNVNVFPVGNGGNLTINTKRFQLTNGTIVSATVGRGNAGNISIFSSDEVGVDNGVITSRVGEGGIGNGGDIQIQTQRLFLTNGGEIDSILFEALNGFPGGQGKAGSIRINASDAVTISRTDENGSSSAILTETQKGALGQGGDVIVNTNHFRITDKGIVSAGTRNSSNGGNIIINARDFEALSGGTVATVTDNSGKAGNITINAKDGIFISGLDSNLLTTANLNSTGNGGTISLSTTNFNLADGAGVLAASLGTGVGGNININAKKNYRANNGFVSARAEQAGGGNINITAGNIRLRNNSDIRTDLSRGQGSGGNITLDADTIIALEDSDILAFAPEGKGGNITFNTRVLLTNPLYSLRQTSTDANRLQSLTNNDRVDINATGAVSGNIIGVPDITFLQNSFTELPDNLIDTNTLIANSCIARSPKQKGTFLITGSGGLPNRPGDALPSTYPTGDVRNVTNDSATRPWKKGDRIVEAEGVYRLGNGQLVMSRECR